MLVSTEMILAIASMVFFASGSIWAIISFIKSGQKAEGILRAITILGTVAIAATLILRGMREGRIPAFGRFEALTCYSLAVAAAYLLTSLRSRMHGLTAVVVLSITGLLLIAMPGYCAHVTPSIAMVSPWLALHVTAAFAGYGFFTLATMFATAYLVQDNNLKHKRFNRSFEHLPALQDLEDLMHRQIGIAFIMLTLSVAAGVRMVWLTGGSATWLTDPKTAATLVTWAVYAIIIHLRLRADWHGRRLALVIVAGLICVLFSFLGVHLLADSLHDFVAIGAGV